MCKKNPWRGKKYSHDQSSQWAIAVTDCGAWREKKINLKSIVLNKMLGNETTNADHKYVWERFKEGCN